MGHKRVRGPVSQNQGKVQKARKVRKEKEEEELKSLEGNPPVTEKQVQNLLEEIRENAPGRRR